jgi:hypothetical protein
MSSAGASCRPSQASLTMATCCAENGARAVRRSLSAFSRHESSSIERSITVEAPSNVRACARANAIEPCITCARPVAARKLAIGRRPASASPPRVTLSVSERRRLPLPRGRVRAETSSMQRRVGRQVRRILNAARGNERRPGNCVGRALPLRPEQRVTVRSGKEILDAWPSRDGHMERSSPPDRPRA